MARSRQIAGIVVLAALAPALAACANNDAKRSDVVDAMTDAGLTDDQAACVGDAFEEEFDQDTLNEIGSASGPEDFPEETRGTVDSILTDCVEGNAEASGGEDTGDTSSTTGTTGEPTGDESSGAGDQPTGGATTTVAEATSLTTVTG